MQLTSDKELLYNAKDSAATLRIASELLPEIEKGGYTDTYRHTIELIQPLIYMMIRGVKVDQIKLQEMKTKCEGLIAQYQKKLNELCGRVINPNSPDDCQRYFYGEKGIKPYTKRNAKGGSSVTVDDKALQRLARDTAGRRGFEEARIIQRIRQLRKLKGTYLEITFDKDMRLRCSYNPRGTRFARISSSKTVFDTGMNMQNLPPAFMQFLVADTGNIFITFDKRQAEWVVVAYASGDASMIKAVESGLDTHTYTASEMFKVPMDIIKMEHKLLGSESSPDEIERKRKDMDFLQPYLRQWLPRNMSMRQCGKKSNHGLNYDEKERMFALINEISDKEAKVIIDFYHRIYPGIRRWYDTVQNKLSKDRTLENLFGRKQRFLDRWGPDLFKSAYSYIPQSSVGELVNRGLVKIYRNSEEYSKELEILMQVHDSIDLQIPIIDVHRIVKCIRMVAAAMDHKFYANGREFSIATDLKIGFTLGTLTEIDLSLNDEELEKAIGSYISEQTTTIGLDQRVSGIR